MAHRLKAIHQRWESRMLRKLRDRACCRGLTHSLLVLIGSGRNSWCELVLTSVRAAFARGIICPAGTTGGIRHRRVCGRQSLIHRCNSSPLANALVPTSTFKPVSWAVSFNQSHTLTRPRGERALLVPKSGLHTVQHVVLKKRQRTPFPPPI